MMSANAQSSQHAKLRLLLDNAGIYKKQHGYYTLVISLTTCMFALSVAGIVITHNSLPFLLLVAICCAFVYVQFAFVIHDAVHDQITDSPRINRAIALAYGFAVWFSPSWWFLKHNHGHHLNPNHLQKDPDVKIPILAFTPLQAIRKWWLFKLIVRYQAILFTPILFLFEAGNIRFNSGKHLLLYLLFGKKKKEVKYPFVEFVLFIAHPLLYFGLLFWLIEPWHAFWFIVVHQGLTGVYLGFVFATNHKGMPMADGTQGWDSLRRQVEPTRNILADGWLGWLINFLMGGLNYQLPHHIDSSIPRCNLRRANEICRDFCKARHIPYYEENVWQAYYRIFVFLHQIGKVLRTKTATSL